MSQETLGLLILIATNIVLVALLVGTLLWPYININTTKRK